MRLLAQGSLFFLGKVFLELRRLFAVGIIGCPACLYHGMGHGHRLSETKSVSQVAAPFRA
jgi:hypothetical protein